VAGSVVGQGSATRSLMRAFQYLLPSKRTNDLEASSQVLAHVAPISSSIQASGQGIYNLTSNRLPLVYTMPSKTPTNTGSILPSLSVAWVL
jgi:hypothetical protein